MNIDRAKMGINSHAVREISALIIIVVALFGALLYWFWGTPPLVDEYDHALQIENFVKGRFELNPSLAMGPGYHVVMAAIAKICGRSDLDMLRLYTTFLSIVCVYAFYITSVQTGNGSHLIRTVQFMALPVIFPYFSLVYSDIFSLLNVLLCYCWQLKKRYVVAGIFAFIAVIARQPSIIWIVMFFAMDYYADNGTKLSVTNILDSLKKNWSYSLLMLLFVLFVIINRGVAIGQESYHEPTFQLVNVFFILLLFGFMYLPAIIANLRELVCLTRSKKVCLTMLTALLLYYFKFNTFHEWNSTYINYTVIHNDIIALIMWYPLWKLIMFIPIGLSIIFIFFSRELNSRHYFLYVTSFVYLSMIFLIEPRYYFPIFTLHCMYRPSQKPRVEVVQTLYLLVLSVVMAYLYKHYNCVF